MRRIFAVWLAIAGTIGISASAVCIPVTNQQGDYLFRQPGQRGGRHGSWQVSDTDPQGLRCRMAKQFQGITADGMNSSEALLKPNRYDVSQWSIVRIFGRGQRIEAVTGNFGDQIVLVDSRGKPWLPIRTAKGDCFVRANSRFIQPVREDSTTLMPLDGNRNFAR